MHDGESVLRLNDGSFLSLFQMVSAWLSITKTRLFKYIENFTSKNWKFSGKKVWYFSYICLKHRLWVLVRTDNEYPQSIFLSSNKKNNVYPYKPQFYYIKVGFKGLKITSACFRNECLWSKSSWSCLWFSCVQTPTPPRHQDQKAHRISEHCLSRLLITLTSPGAKFCMNVVCILTNCHLKIGFSYLFYI